MSELQMPHGIPVKSYRGPGSIEELNDTLQKDAFTGYIRASIMEKARILEAIVVYSGGKPVQALTSENDKDRADPFLHGVTAIFKDEASIIEIFSLKDAQARLLMDFGKNFFIAPDRKPEKKPEPARPAPILEAKPVLKDVPKEPEKKTDKTAKKTEMPGIRGRFIRSESVTGLRPFLQSRPDITGHAILVTPQGSALKDSHAIIVKGEIVGAYSDTLCGRPLMDKLMVTGGQVELYYLDEQIIGSILKQYPHILTSVEPEPETAEAPKARPVGIPASAFLDRSPKATKVTPVMNEDLEDDVAIVKKVETEFLCDADELLKKLELSHLRVTDLKKKGK